MNFQAIGSNQKTIQRIRIANRISELTLEVMEALEEHSFLQQAPWWDFKAMVRRMKLRRFVMDINEQLRVYRDQLQDMYNEQQNEQKKWN